MSVDHSESGSAHRIAGLARLHSRRGSGTSPDSTSQRSMQSAPSRTSRRAHLAAACFFAALITAFLGPAITHTHAIYNAVDITQDEPIQSVGTVGYTPKNPLHSDPPTQNLAWALYDRQEIRAGHLPIWNPYNAGGVPQLGNDQSAVFSPFSFPYYVLPVALAVLASAWLKLFTLSFATWAYLRRRRLSVGASLVGGTAFAFAGYQIIWLDWAHIGSTTLLPLCAWAAELVVQERGRRQRVGIAGTAIGLATGLTAGHPETGFYCALALVPTVLLALHSEHDTRRRLLATGRVACGALLGLGLAAAQVLPFLQYTHLSTTYEFRSSVLQPSGVPMSALGMLGFPDALGNPALGSFQPGYIYQANWNEGNGDYVGIPLLVLAVIGLGALWLRRYRGTGGLGAALAVIGFAGWHILAISHAVERLPILKLGSLNRAHDIWDWGVALLAACAVDALARAAISVRQRLAVSLAVGVGTAGAFVGLLVLAIRSRAEQNRLAHSLITVPRNLRLWHQHVAFVLLTVVLINVAIFALLLLRGTRGRLFAASTTAIVVWLSLGLLLQNQNPVVSKRYFYPNTPGMQLSAGLAGQDPSMRLGTAAIFPNTNLVYDTWHPEVIDALGVSWYDDLFAATFHTADPTYFSEGVPSCVEQLRLFGMRYVVSHGSRAEEAGRVIAPDGTSLTVQGDMSQLPRVASAGGFNAFAVPASTGVATVVPATKVVRDTAAAVAAVSACPFDSDASAVLVATGQGASVEAASQMTGGSARETGVHQTSIDLTTDGGGGELVVRRTYYPGWSATVDGRAVRLDRADAAFMGVPVTAGHHKIRLRYHSAVVRYGLAISFASILGVAALLAAGTSRGAMRRRRRRRRDVDGVSGGADIG